MLDPNLTPGTPVQYQATKNRGDVWRAHSVLLGSNRVPATSPAMRPLNSQHPGHDDPAQEMGAIPPTCQPTYASRRAWEALTLARETQRVIEQN